MKIGKIEQIKIFTQNDIKNKLSFSSLFKEIKKNKDYINFQCYHAYGIQTPKKLIVFSTEDFFKKFRIKSQMENELKKFKQNANKKGD